MNVPTPPFHSAQLHRSLDSQEEAKEYLSLPPQSNHSTQIEYVTSLKNLAITEESLHPIITPLFAKRYWPEGENERVLFVIPSSSVCSAAPVPASQNLTVWSSEPDATTLQSGENATEPGFSTSQAETSSSRD
jgi:hypothetical protein